MWDLPGPGLEPVSPALVGGFLTVATLRKPRVGTVDVNTDKVCQSTLCGRFSDCSRRQHHLEDLVQHSLLGHTEYFSYGRVGTENLRFS